MLTLSPEDKKRHEMRKHEMRDRDIMRDRVEMGPRMDKPTLRSFIQDKGEKVKASFMEKIKDADNISDVASIIRDYNSLLSDVRHSLRYYYNVKISKSQLEKTLQLLHIFNDLKV